VGDKAAVRPEDRKLQPSSSTRASAPHILIGKTSQTLVSKTTHKDAIIAIKLCRRRTAKESANRWRMKWR
jgi:hypothetical protein